MKKIHNKLVRSSRWYAKWHATSYHSAVHTLFFVAFCLIVSGIIFSSVKTAGAQEIPPQRPQFSIDISSYLKGRKGVGGDEAIDILGRKISTIARAYGLSTSELKHSLQHDTTLKIDKTGMLFFSDTALPDPQKASLGDGTIPNNPTTVEIPDELTFKLHSKPSQSAKIWLNFQGATTQNTYWNTNGPIISAPFSMDSDPAFSSAELDVIKAVWRSVAEDYAAFDVDVTTEPNTNYNYDNRHFMQVIISPSWEWFGQAGGVAYMNSFTWGDGTPAFVFSSLLGNRAKYIAEAAAHEAGHTVGLYHTAVYDTACNYVQEYSYGYGSNPGWGPIMGAGYYVGVSQWTKSSEWPLLATSHGCTVEQDDLSVMTQAIKLSADDVGNSATSAGTLSRTVSNGVAYVDQLASMGQNDIDVFKFSTIGGDIKLSVKAVPAIGLLMGDADVTVRLLDSGMNVVAESNPAAIADAYIEKLAAPSGTYYLEVSASGYLDLTQPGGYSTYGSMGRYQIVGTYTASTPSSDTISPTVSLTSPADGSTVSNSVSITATASDNVGVDHVDFYRGTALIGADASAPYDITWDTTQVTNGSYSLVAKAYDAAGNAGTSNQISVTVSNTVTPPPDTTAPLATLTLPAAGSTVSGVVTLSATASDAVGVTKVSFFDGTTLISTDTTASPDYAITWDTTKVANGSHTLTAKAYDAAGNIGTSYPVIVYASNVLPAPVVTITAPKDGSVFTGTNGNITIQASATGANPIYRITIYVDDKYVTSVKKSSISYKWGMRNIAPGQHVIRVEAQDTRSTNGSSSITITKQ